MQSFGQIQFKRWRRRHLCQLTELYQIYDDSVEGSLQASAKSLVYSRTYIFKNVENSQPHWLFSDIGNSGFDVHRFGMLQAIDRMSLS